MSDSCLRSDPSAPAPGGFTLLELLIVLALVAMVAAMVAPRLQRTYEAVARSGARAEAVRQLERLPVLARDSGHAIVVEAGDAAPLGRLLALPAGWQAAPVESLRIEASGLCHGTRVRVQGDGATETWALSTPDCTVSDAP